MVPELIIIEEVVPSESPKDRIEEWGRVESGEVVIKESEGFR